jgi:hypothetical protein
VSTSSSSWVSWYEEKYPRPIQQTGHPYRRPKSRETIERERVERQVLRDVCKTCHLSHPGEC